MAELAEPWLRGLTLDVHPALAPTLHAFQQAREDLARHTAGLTPEQIWASPHGLTPLGFHLRHIAGSVHRLTTYLRGEQLSDEQMNSLRAEKNPGAPSEELLSAIDAALNRAEQQIRSIDPGTLGEPRAVGRQQLPTTVIGLVVHIAEHTQRHVGQAISAAKLARASTPGPG
jgi:uncharacterized damage-inducible protein DinB